MNAQEAREKTEIGKLTFDNGQYEKCKNSIKISTGCGEYRAVVLEKIHDHVKAKLESEGYNIEDNTVVESLFIITWNL